MAQRQSGQSAIATLIYITYGPVLWGMYHGALYAIHWLLCAKLPPGTTVLGVGLIPATLLLVSALACAAIVFGIARPDLVANLLKANTRPEFFAFSRKAMRLLAILSLFGVAAAALTVAFLPACHSIR